MRRWPRSLWFGLALGVAGCVNHARPTAAPPPVAVRRTPTTQPEPPPDLASPVARSVSPDPPAFLESPVPLLTDRPPLAPPSHLPRDLDTCPVDPLLGMLAGSKDEQTRQDAMNAIGLMLATGTAQALRRTGGGATRNVAGGIHDLLQTDDDQSSVSKSRRPPVLFTLGWKF